MNLITLFRLRNLLLGRIPQRLPPFLSGAYPDHIPDIIDEQFSIAGFSGMQHLFCGIDHQVNGNMADRDLNLDLGKETGIQGEAFPLPEGALLYAAAHHIGDGDACDTDGVHGLNDIFQHIRTGYDRNLEESAGIRIGFLIGQRSSENGSFLCGDHIAEA